MMYHLTGGRWGKAVRPALEITADSALWIGLFFVPILLGMHRIYPWLLPDAAHDPKIVHKSAYLNVPFFCIRAVFYFACWALLRYFLKRWSGDDARVRSLSAGGLVLYSLTASFASFDWQMSLEPHWYSTIYGMIYCVAQLLTAYAFGLIIFSIFRGTNDIPGTLKKNTLFDLGNILLAFVIVWTYLSFMQYLVIWMGNLAEEAPWFIHRLHGGWQYLAIILILFQFSVPFAALLFRDIKERVPLLGVIAAVVFGVHAIDRYWVAMPSLYPDGIRFHWLDVTTFLAIGGLWMASVLKKLEVKAHV
jgi:hypothetical protein